MRRSGWLVVLAVCLVAILVAGLGISADSAPEDIGSIEVSMRHQAMRPRAMKPLTSRTLAMSVPAQHPPFRK